MKTKPVAALGDTPPLKKRSVEDWISAIDELIGKQKRTVFEIGDLLIQAEAALPKTQFRNVLKASGLRSKQNANNYMRVARAEHLRKPKIFDHLPTTVGTLIDLAAWSERQVTEAIRTKIIHPQSERKNLRRWNHSFLFGSTVKQKPAETARVVGYVMCDIATYESDRIERFQEQFDEIKLQFLDGDMFIAPYADDLWSQHRRTMLAKRVWDAYTDEPALFVDPAFHDLIKREAINDSSMQFHLSAIAPLIASGDHKRLHKIIQFSKSDWKFFGVSEIGYATLLSYFTELPESRHCD
jgi:hypothetical protein